MVDWLWGRGHFRKEEFSPHLKGVIIPGTKVTSPKSLDVARRDGGPRDVEELGVRLLPLLFLG